MQRKVVCCFLILIIFCLIVACSSGSPSDDEAARLVKEYYLFNYGGRQVEVKIISRKKFNKENKSYPIEFLIMPPGQKNFQKTFYFYKNEQGMIEIREY
ncbi:MAG: hypothetical protein HZC49_08135 [Nitrospirae bacterium]|nr:hypothetical protein [Nitrospirota bacterium]